MKHASLAVSFVFHPALMASIGIAVLLYSPSHISLLPVAVKNYLAGFVFISTAAIPLALIGVFRYLHLIQSVYLTEARQRMLPMVVVSALYGLVAWRFLTFPAPLMVKYFLLVTCCLLGVSSAVTWFWKISLHLIALGGVSGLFFLVFWLFDPSYLLWLCMALFASGMVGTARLYMKEHTPAQVYAGFVVGFVAMVVPLVAMRYQML